jgi:hypothetical protein
MKSAPPGWKRHQITHRVDGWIVDPANKRRIPAAVAEMIARAMPQPGRSVVDVRARMFARQRMHDSMSECIND